MRKLEFKLTPSAYWLTSETDLWHPNMNIPRERIEDNSRIDRMLDHDLEPDKDPVLKVFYRILENDHSAREPCPVRIVRDDRSVEAVEVHDPILPPSENFPVRHDPTRKDVDGFLRNSVTVGEGPVLSGREKDLSIENLDVCCGGEDVLGFLIFFLNTVNSQYRYSIWISIICIVLYR